MNNAGAKKPDWWRELAKTLGNWSCVKLMDLMD